MPAVTFNLTAGDATRISNVAAASGFPADGKAWVIKLVQQAVQQYEQQQQLAAYLGGYTPVAPT
jgi:hypothetical protein